MGFDCVDNDSWIFSPAPWGDVDEASVRKAFDGTSDGRLSITAVRRCYHRDARAVRFLDSTKGRGAWAFGWYGAAAHHVQVAADGGDLTVNWPLLGAVRAHGRGIHLSVQGKPMPSVELSVASMNDQQTAHLLFCVLSPGFPEIIDAGSPQSQASSPLFRSGTDAMENPTWHVIWESSAGTQILPLYMVSFRPTQRYKRTGSPHEEASIQKKVRLSV
ncbi:hypothetical protein SEVIR_5G038200v4 [Setaria viridis]|uniref:Uncharacterized protein n=2 Tax=Setaria viridis TaxID=4556 RepID=A0A4U6UFJ6_SETVI|nr:hypothetical protein SEVIR_5G038200v2 [Setaria viridis]